MWGGTTKGWLMGHSIIDRVLGLGRTPISSPLYNPLYNPPIRSLDYSS